MEKQVIEKEIVCTHTHISSQRIEFSDVQELRIFSSHAPFLWKQLENFFS